MPKITKTQILKHANHQFIEGVAQHWWHEDETKEQLKYTVDLSEEGFKNENEVGWEIETKNKSKGKGDKGIRTNFSYDLLCFPYCTFEYIKRTKDFSILNESVHFITGKTLDENIDEEYFTLDISSVSRNIYEHCIRAIDKSISRIGKRYASYGKWRLQ